VGGISDVVPNPIDEECVLLNEMKTWRLIKCRNHLKWFSIAKSRNHLKWFSNAKVQNETKLDITRGCSHAQTRLLISRKSKHFD